MTGSATGTSVEEKFKMNSGVTRLLGRAVLGLGAGCVLAFGAATHAATVPEVLDAGNQWLVAQAASQD
ncbi:MAG: hypothetical protein ACPGJF_16580, partial [Sinimarinibacterium flocculans]